jgi:Tfp pilus assembly protein PilX
MSRRRRIHAHLPRRLHAGSLPAARSPLRAEAGFAVPTVTLMLIAAMALAGVAVTASIGGQSGIVRDRDTKSALQLAEAGVEQVLYQFNSYGLVSSNGTSACAPVGGGEPDSQGWCPEVSATINGEPVSYRVKPTSTAMPSGDIAWTKVEVVSVATLAGVTRRIDVAASSSAGQNIFLDATVQSEDGIQVKSNAEIHAGTATNGTVYVGKNASQCGTTTVGVGEEPEIEGQYSTQIECTTVGGEPGEDEITLDPVLAGDTATNNNNARLFTQDHVSGSKSRVCFDGHEGFGKADNSCGPRELLVESNSAVTLGGNVYSFCKLTLESNSSLYIQPGMNVKIYFDSPEACGYAGDEEPVVQLELLSNARIAPVSGKSANVALLFVGSDEIATRAILNSNTSLEDPLLCAQNFVVYGPRTDIELQSNTSFCGAMAGKTVTLLSNSQIWTSSGVKEFFLPLVAPHYVANRFVDCAATVGSAYPNEGC